jgi:hypothetical protein
MKILLWIAGGLLFAVLLVLGLQVIASERVEVVELETQDSAGQPVVTRLWIVDDEGSPYLRAGRDQSGWYGRLRARSEVRVTRGGKTQPYKAVARPELAERINHLMDEKYTWGNAIIGVMIGGRDGSMPVQLMPVD